MMNTINPFFPVEWLKIVSETFVFFFVCVRVCLLNIIDDYMNFKDSSINLIHLHTNQYLFSITTAVWSELLPYPLPVGFQGCKEMVFFLSLCVRVCLLNSIDDYMNFKDCAILTYTLTNTCFPLPLMIWTKTPFQYLLQRVSRFNVGIILYVNYKSDISLFLAYQHSTHTHIHTHTNTHTCK